MMGAVDIAQSKEDRMHFDRLLKSLTSQVKSMFDDYSSDYKLEFRRWNSSLQGLPTNPKGIQCSLG